MEIENANNPVVEWLRARPVLAKTIFWTVVLGIPVAGAALVWREIQNGHLSKVIILAIGALLGWLLFGAKRPVD